MIGHWYAFRVSDQIGCCQRSRQQLRVYNDVSLQPLTIMRASQSLFSSLIAISFAFPAPLQTTLRICELPDAESARNMRTSTSSNSARRRDAKRGHTEIFGWEPCLANPIERLRQSKSLLRSRLLHSSPVYSQAMHMQAGSQSNRALLTESYRRVSGRLSRACAQASRRSCLSFRLSQK